MQHPDNQEQINLVLGGNARAVNALVGKTMKTINRQGDPIAIKKLLLESIAEKKRTGGFTPKKDAENVE